MKLSLLLLFSLFTASATYACDESGNTGFLPENDLWIPVNSKNLDGITEEQFNKVIDKAIEIYEPIVNEQEGNLVFKRLWTDGTVNAYAQRTDKDWIVGMYGGLARRKEVTEDGFALVVCHELGHHLGGAPRKGTRWAANEGQSDYWGTLKCFRKYSAEDNNVEIVREMKDVPESVTESCAAQFEDENDAAICVRGSMGGLSLGNLLNNLRSGEIPVNFETPSSEVVTRTNDSHPKAQCRLDSYYQGSLCKVIATIDTDNDDADIGTCNRNEKFEIGLRPLCWFRPVIKEEGGETSTPSIVNVHY